MLEKLITSASNKQIRQVVQLMTKRKERELLKRFVFEGIRMFREAPEGFVEKVFVSESFWNKCQEKHLFKESITELVKDDVFHKMSDTKTPQGVLCIAKQPFYDRELLVKDSKGVYLVLENIQDPGNLGSIFRTAEAAGVNAIFMTRNTVDLFNLKTIRATMGSVYRVPFAYIDSVDEIVSEFHRNEIDTYATFLGKSESYLDVNYQKGFALIVGNEGNGLSEQTALLAHKRIIIPMQGKIESLNAAIATSIVLYEAVRQRTKLEEGFGREGI